MSATAAPWRRRAWIAAALVLAGAAGAALWGLRAGPDEPYRLRPDDAQALRVGERVYAAHCAQCHGSRLEGQPDWRRRGADGRLPAPPHDASGHTWHHRDEVLFRITKHGVAKAANLPGYDSAMPAYEGVLSDEEIVAVLSWIKSRWPAGIRARHDEIDRAGSR